MINIFVKGVMKAFFPDSVSYDRFVELMLGIVFPLFCFLQTRIGQDTGISFVDSTDLTVCHIKRSYSNRTFKDIASKGKTTTGWFFGFKLHIVINDEGELLTWQLTYANTDDRKPVPRMLYQRGLKLITRLRSNMKNKLMSLPERLLLKKRGLIESVNEQLKNVSQIEHTRHRSVWNFLSNLMGGLLSYTFQKEKPSLNLRD